MLAPFSSHDPVDSNALSPWSERGREGGGETKRGTLRASARKNEPKLHKSSSLDRTFHISQIPQHKIYQLLVPLFTQPAHEALAGELLRESVRRQAILGKTEIEEGGDGYLRRAELLLLLDQIGAADETDSTFVSER